MAGRTVRTLAKLLRRDGEAVVGRVLSGIGDGDICAFDRDWESWAHDGQLEPAGDWRVWVMMAGRGFGKTRGGAEWVGAMARAHADLRIALVAATVDEARRIMVEGPSGLIAVAGQRVCFEPSLRRLRFESGAEAFLYSGASPEALRGPEHHVAWCDELAKWKKPQESWDMLQLGLRLGDRPRALVTTTPRGGAGGGVALRRILDGAGTVVTGGATQRNPHLPHAFVEAVTAAYGGTRLGRQEIDGVLVDEVEGALWTAEVIEKCRSGPPPTPPASGRGDYWRVVIGVDPPASADGVCGIVVCALDAAGIGHVLGDHSAGGLSPERWAARVAAAAEAHGADRIVAEQNQGGDMVRTVLMGADRRLPVTLVSASRGKSARAEPVAALFEAGRVRLAGRFEALEAELRGLVAGGGYEGPGRSPDRADAMVWALTALMLAPKGEPRVRMT